MEVGDRLEGGKAECGVGLQGRERIGTLGHEHQRLQDTADLDCGSRAGRASVPCYAPRTHTRFQDARGGARLSVGNVTALHCPLVVGGVLYRLAASVATWTNGRSQVSPDSAAVSLDIDCTSLFKPRFKELL